MRSNRNGASVSAPSTNRPSADPLQPVAEAIRLQLRAAPGERADRVVRDQLAHGRHEHARDLRGRELGATVRTRAATRPRRPSTPGGPDAARRRGTRRPRRRAPRTRPGARPGRPARSRGRPAARRARRARGSRPATSSSGGIGAERGDQALHRREGRARRGRTGPLRRAEAVDRRRRAGPATSGVGPMPSYGSASHAGRSADAVVAQVRGRARRRAPRPRADRAPRPGPARPARAPARRRRRPRPPRRARRSAGRARAGAARTAPSAINASSAFPELTTLPPIASRT